MSKIKSNDRYTVQKRGLLDLEKLKSLIDKDEIDTVLVCQVDMQGRLMGKRFDAEFFLESGHKETHSCNYLLATDLEMNTVDGFMSTGWSAGYGDYVMKPDISTLRVAAWQPRTALVICDMLDHHDYKPVAHSPRAILNKQQERLTKMKMKAFMASELEFFLYQESYATARTLGYRNLTPSSPNNQDYNMNTSYNDEGVMRSIRNGLKGSGIIVESSKGEASAGQEEINVKYDDALIAADNHAIIKLACRDIAYDHGHAITFLSKPRFNHSGSSSHVHQSLWSEEGEPLFYDPQQTNGMSILMQHYLAGLLKYAEDITCFLAPYVNSYKRFQSGTFAPTKIIWSDDNRTAGFRICGANSKSIRIECRIGGSDLTPHLAYAVMLAAGLAGIEEKLPLPPQAKGNLYTNTGCKEIPKTLRDAIDKLDQSKMLRKALGNDVIEHYLTSFRWEQAEFDRAITDWELARGFERV